MSPYHWPCLMVDIEALGGSPGGVIVQIAAQAFRPLDRDNMFGPLEVYNLAIQDQLAAGRYTDESTITWWMDQSKEARDGVFKTQKVPVDMAINGLRLMVERHKITEVWSHAIYDFVMLEDLARSFRTLRPFKYTSARDIRTLQTLWVTRTGNKECDVGPFEGTKHTAADDVRHQIKYVSAMIRGVTTNVAYEPTE